MWCAPKHERTRKTRFFYFWQCWKIIHKRAPLLRAIQTFDLTSRNRDMRFENGAHFISAYKHPELFFGYSSEKRITCGAQSSFSFQRCNEDLYFFRDMLRAWLRTTSETNKCDARVLSLLSRKFFVNLWDYIDIINHAQSLRACALDQSGFIPNDDVNSLLENSTVLVSQMDIQVARE